MRFLSSRAVGVTNHRGDGVDDRLWDGARDFGSKPPEVISLFRPRKSSHRGCGRSSSRARLDDPGAHAAEYALSFGLWQEFPDRTFRGHKKWQSMTGSKSIKACRDLAEVAQAMEQGRYAPVVEKMQQMRPRVVSDKTCQRRFENRVNRPV